MPTTLKILALPLTISATAALAAVWVCFYVPLAIWHFAVDLDADTK